MHIVIDNINPLCGYEHIVLPTGFPAAFHTVEEVVKFTTMVIFTTTVRHAAVHSGQVNSLSLADQPTAFVSFTITI